MDETLKPCPFCGGSWVITHRPANGSQPYISCKECNASGPLTAGMTEAQWRAAWNTRADAAPTQKSDEVKAVARAVHGELSHIDVMKYLDMPDNTADRVAQAAIAALDAARGKAEPVARALTDPQRMLWKDDVEGICPSIDLCFEYGDTARCWPCAAKQSASLGVSVDTSQPNLPEVSRLRRELKAQGDRVAQVVEWLRKENGLCDCHARCETECGCGAWDDWKTKPLLEIADAIERGEPFNG